MLLGPAQGEGLLGETQRLIEAASDMCECRLDAQKVPRKKG